MHACRVEQSDGTFWQIDTPERRTSGQLLAGGDERPILVTDKAIFAERKFSVSRLASGHPLVTRSSDPEDLVADFQPRTIHGELADGTPVTLVHAQGDTRRLEFLRDPSEASQQFRARYALSGDLVTADQTYRAVRFQVVGPSWWDAAEDVAQTADGGLLRTYCGGQGERWIEFTNSDPMTFDHFDSGVINAVTTITQLATKDDAAAVGLQVQLVADGPWRDVHRGRESVAEPSHILLDTRYLTAKRFATWIDFRSETQGLDAAVVDSLQGATLEAQVLTLVAVAEGLHRRLFRDKNRRVTSLSDSKIKKMCRRARNAALPEMDGPDFTDEDRAEFSKAVTEAFGHINDQTFRSRMADLIADARLSIPNIVAGFADWPDAVSTARNLMAHQPSLPDHVDDRQFLDLLIALSYSITWVLRTNLLNRAGFDAATLQEGYGYSSSYGHHLANTRELLAGGPWVVDESR